MIRMAFQLTTTAVLAGDIDRTALPLQPNTFLAQAQYFINNFQGRQP